MEQVQKELKKKVREDVRYKNKLDSTVERLMSQNGYMRTNWLRQ